MIMFDLELNLALDLALFFNEVNKLPSLHIYHSRVNT